MSHETHSNVKLRVLPVFVNCEGPWSSAPFTSDNVVKTYMYFLGDQLIGRRSTSRTWTKQSSKMSNLLHRSDHSNQISVISVTLRNSGTKHVKRGREQRIHPSPHSGLFFKPFSTAPPFTNGTDRQQRLKVGLQRNDNATQCFSLLEGLQQKTSFKDSCNMRSHFWAVASNLNH